MNLIKKSAWSALLVLGVLFAASGAQAEHHEDAEAIKQAVLNYANSFYEMNPKLVDKSIHPKVQKVGYAPKKEGSGYKEMWMNFDELKELAKHWNADGHMDAATAKREIKILVQLDQTATVRLNAEWGIDFIHLAKKGDKWMIMNVIWQTYPPE
jgi:hypothetical protein